MRLSPQQVEHLKLHLQTKFKNPCHICGTGNWQFDDVIFELRQFMGGGVSTEGLIKPVIAVTCGDCGHVVTINAFAAGVLRVQQPEANPQGGSQSQSGGANPSPSQAQASTTAKDKNDKGGKKK